MVSADPLLNYSHPCDTSPMLSTDKTHHLYQDPGRSPSTGNLLLTTSEISNPRLQVCDPKLQMTGPATHPLAPRAPGSGAPGMALGSAAPGSAVRCASWKRSRPENSRGSHIGIPIPIPIHFHLHLYVHVHAHVHLHLLYIYIYIFTSTSASAFSRLVPLSS